MEPKKIVCETGNASVVAAVRNAFSPTYGIEVVTSPNPDATGGLLKTDRHIGAIVRESGKNGLFWTGVNHHTGMHGKGFEVPYNGGIAAKIPAEQVYKVMAELGEYFVPPSAHYQNPK